MVSNKNTISNDTIAMMDFELNRKKKLDAYMLWFLLGFFGAHRFYLGQGWSAKVMLFIAIRILIALSAGVIVNLSWMGWNEIASHLEVISGILAFVLVPFWLIDATLIPNMVKQYNKKLSQDESVILSDNDAITDFNANKKNVGVAYLLLLFIGGSGAHRFYLKQSSAKTMLFISFFAEVLLFLDIIVDLFLLRFGPPDFSDTGFTAICVVFVWRVIDAFRIPRMVKEYNKDLVSRIKNGDKDE